MPIPAGSAAPSLFTPGELAEWLDGTVTEGRGAMMERVVWGWLKPILKLEVRPTPVPEEVFSWAVELGAIAHENPDGLSEKELGPGRKQFSAERRQEILDLAAEGGTTTGALTPLGSFPPAQRYPDPAFGW